ncbi:MAG TPA: NADH-quinone oxidoreductase subunit L [Acidimicrobiia bacterium]|nr:NADH-quinone oxidoreductase subunit L [Acidimicrobiia bacterium]
MSAHETAELAWLIPAFPLAGTTILWLGRRRLREPVSGWIATLTMAAAFAAAVVVFSALTSLPADERAVERELFDWIPAGGFNVRALLLVDPLSVTMTLFVTGVGALIHLYSIGYMHGEARFTRFFTFLNLFAFSMLVLVLAGDYLLLFLGWEGVGLCSYLLISFWFERTSAAVAGKKAFVTNRVGDFGFMLAMFLIFAHFGTLEILPVLHDAEHLAAGTATAIALLLFVGAAGKSAQGPLFVWLPDAMEGPTPVSALIHAATMVTAGVYLMARSHPFLQHSDIAPDVVAWVGAGTALVAATIALVNNDIKRVLAYSTISQLGYMFLAVGLGAYAAAVFHMVTHAFFKALMFLGAGSVIHGLHDEQDMLRMGGLRKLMPITAMTFLFGWLAIAGIIPFAGFWSKDEILAVAFVDGQYALWAVGAVTALLTALYMSRQVWLVFYGNERWKEHVHGRVGSGGGTVKPHESPALLTFPLVVLAALALAGGLLNLPFKGWQLLGEWLHPVFEGVEEVHPETFLGGFVLSTVALTLGVIGIAVAWKLYRGGLAKGQPDPVRARLGPAGSVFSRGYGIDLLYARVVDGPGRKVSGWLAGAVDQGVVDGAVNGTAAGVAWTSRLLRRAQTGFLRNYALAVFTGGTAVLFFLVARGSL